jgi:ligand-binding SRPBCC domain-containing protein
VHDHYFEEAAGETTVIRDVVSFRSPLGVLGAIVDRLILSGYLARLISRRQQSVKDAAEVRS